MYMFRSRVVNVPAREKIIRLAFAEECGIDYKEKAESVTTFLVFAKSGKKRLFWNDGSERADILRNFFKCARRVLKGLTRADSIKTGRFYLTNAFASDAGAVADRFKSLALWITAKTKTANEHLAGAL